MYAHAELVLPSGVPVVASSGDLVGRMWTAAVHIDDARVSEAHAMVSLRGRELKLLALRGRFAVDGRPLTEVVLAPGLRIELAEGLVLVVREVVLPDEVLAIEGEGVVLQILGGVCSIVVRPRGLGVVARYDPRALARIWSVGSGFRLQVGDGAPRPLEAGDRFEVEGRSLRAVAVPLERAARAETRLRGAIGRPLRIVAMYDTVHVISDSEVVLALGGIAARILSEIAVVGVPTDWEPLAREIWPEPMDRSQLRHKWDVNLSRLRTKLKAARVRSDLIRSDGAGNFELLLNDGDSVEDRT